MSCTLRILGQNLDVDHLITTSGLLADKVFYKGQPRLKSNPNSNRHNYSGLTVIVSSAGFEQFREQVADVKNFLEKNRMKLNHIKNISGVEFATIDFGVRYNEATDLQTFFLPPELISLLSEFELSIELSIYTYDDN